MVDKAGGLVSLISLLFASIQQNALTLIDDFAVLNCSHSSPEGACGAELGRHGAMNPAGRIRGCKDIARGIRDHERAGQCTRLETGISACDASKS